MAITFPVSKRARVIPTSNAFSSAYSAGVYDFSLTAGNTKQTVIPLSPNTIYYVDNFSVGGNITAEDFLSCVNTVPLLTLSRKQDGQSIYDAPFPINQFFQNKEATAFFSSNKGGDELQATLTGILSQNINIVGVSPVIITLSLAVYAIDDAAINADFRDQLLRRV